MTGRHAGPDRRTVLRALGAIGLIAAAPACSAGFTGTRLTVATGVMRGNYFVLGTALAQAWTEQLDLDTGVESTGGSVDNLARLAARAADVAFSQVDTVSEALARMEPGDPRAPRALARIYDDVVHVVVRASSPATTLADLRGARVSIGARDSGVLGVATRLLEAAGLSPDSDLRPETLGLEASVAALQADRIDAFFWSGGLPTGAVSDLARTVRIRLLDLDDVLPTVRAAHREYAPGTVPAASYGIAEPITTLLVRNFLLVRAEMDAELAQALVATLFRAQAQLALVSPLALTIDLRSAIGTQPVPLHPGAERWFREAKD